MRRGRLLAGGAVLGVGLLGAGVLAARRRASPPGVASPQPEPAAIPPPPLAGRLRDLRTPDGVVLHVEEHGPEDPSLSGVSATVVLVHGYVQSSRLWAGQVRDIVEARPDLRVLVYDHRGHGRSGRTSRDAAHLEQLGRDLAQLLDEVVPAGPVVLAGHSMGGMTVMALAEQRPELFRPPAEGGRVAGVAFVATSAGGLAGENWGLPRPVAAALRAVTPALQEKLVRDEARGRPRRSAGALERRLVFGRGADPEHVREVLEVQAATSAETVAAFRPTFSDHDRVQALAALADVPAVVLVGDRDLLCPLPHSRAIAAALPRAELVVYPGVGHMVQIERRPEVSRRLLALLDRVVPAGATST